MFQLKRKLWKERKKNFILMKFLFDAKSFYAKNFYFFLLIISFYFIMNEQILINFEI